MADLSEQVPDPYVGYSSADIQRAYHVAAHTRNTAAMEELHKALLGAYKREDAAAYDPTSGMSTYEKLAAGAGHAAQRGIEGVGNILGIGPSDQALREEDERAKALLATGAGRTGDILGQVGMAAIPATGTARLVGGVAKAAPKAKFLYNALRASMAANEGALQGAAYASPDEQAKAAGQGAILGGTLGAAGRAGGRVLRGIVEKSPAAQALIDAAKQQGKDLFLPISQAAQSGFGLSGMAKGLYQHVLPYAIGVESQLKGQAGKAGEDLRTVRANMAMSELKDPKTGEPLVYGSMEGPTAEHTAQNLLEAHTKAIKDNFDTLGFDLPLSFRDQVFNSFKKNVPSLGDAQAEKMTNSLEELAGKVRKADGTIDGEALRGAIKKAEGIGNSVGDEVGLSGLGKHAADQFRSLIDQARYQAESTIKNYGGTAQGQAANEFVRKLDNYRVLSNLDDQVQNVLEDTEGAASKRGAYGWPEVANRAAPGTPIGELGRNASEVLGQTPASVNPAGRAAYHILTGGVPGAYHGISSGDLFTGLAGGLGSEAATGLAGNVMATRPIQNALYGQGFGGLQEWMARQLNQNPNAAYQLGLAGRMGAGEELQQ